MKRSKRFNPRSEDAVYFGAGSESSGLSVSLCDAANATMDVRRNIVVNERSLALFMTMVLNRAKVRSAIAYSRIFNDN